MIFFKPESVRGPLLTCSPLHILQLDCSFAKNNNINVRFFSYSMNLTLSNPYRFYFLTYMVFLLVLTAALALAAESPNPSLYCDGIDWFRLFLEILTIIVVGFSAVSEVVEFWRI